MTRPVVLLDADGPLFDFTQGYLDALHTIVPGQYRLVMVDRWAIHECSFFVRAAARAGMTPSQLKAAVADLVIRPGFTESLAVQRGAKQAVSALREIAEVYVVTAPWDSSPTWMHERMHAIHKHFDIPRAHVLQTATKHIVHGDVFVDDKPSNVRSWGKRWPGSHALLFDMHHNQTGDIDLERATWDRVIERTKMRVELRTIGQGTSEELKRDLLEMDRAYRHAVGTIRRVKRFLKADPPRVGEALEVIGENAKS